MRAPKWPRWLIFVAAITTALALVPLALVAKARTTTSTKPRINIVPDMDNQPKFRAQQANPMFADGRAGRLPVAGTVARGELRDDTVLYAGKTAGRGSPGRGRAASGARTNSRLRAGPPRESG